MRSRRSGRNLIIKNLCKLIDAIPTGSKHNCLRSQVRVQNYVRTPGVKKLAVCSLYNIFPFGEKMEIRQMDVETEYINCVASAQVLILLPVLCKNIKVGLLTIPGFFSMQPQKNIPCFPH